MTVETFEKLLLEAVDDALVSLGDSAREAIYFHLESKFGISRENIPQSLAEFLEGLEKIFGVGTRFLEILMMKELHKKIEHPLEWNERKEFMFIEYVEAAKHSFLEARKGN